VPSLSLPAEATITIPRATLTSPAAALVTAPNHERRDFFWVHLFARLKPGVTREQANAEINPLFGGIRGGPAYLGNL